jgi:hypothetical protein
MRFYPNKRFKGCRNLPNSFNFNVFLDGTVLALWVIQKQTVMKTIISTLIIVFTITVSSAMAAPKPGESKHDRSAKRRIARTTKVSDKTSMITENMVCFVNADEFFASKWRRHLPKKRKYIC